MAARRLGRAVLSLNRKVISVDVFNHLLRSARAEEGWVHLSALVQLVFFFFSPRRKSVSACCQTNRGFTFLGILELFQSLDLHVVSGLLTARNKTVDHLRISEKHKEE